MELHFSLGSSGAALIQCLLFLLENIRSRQAEGWESSGDLQVHRRLLLIEEAVSLGGAIVALEPYNFEIPNMDREKLIVTITSRGNGEYYMRWRPKNNDTVKSRGKFLNHSKILEAFPDFCKAVDLAHADLNPAVPLETLQMVAGVSYCVPKMNSKRHLVYTHLAYACSFMDRTELPAAVVDAIRLEWSEPGESFTGFRDN